MSDTPQGSQYGEQRAPTEWVGSGDPPGGPGGSAPAASSGGSGRGRRRGVLIGAGVATIALLGGGAAVAFTVLNGGGAQPDAAVPSGAIAYTRIDLDPSAEQKVNAVRLLRRVPQFEEETGITADRDDLRQRLYEEAVSEGGGGEGCPDYADDVEPWLGDRAGFAAMPADDGGDPDPLAVLQVSDEEAARTGIAKIVECTGAEQSGIAFVSDYAVIAETQDLADGFAAAAEEAPLADDAGYQADMDALDGEGIVSGWLDVDALVEDTLTDEEKASAEAAGLGQTESVAMALSAGSDSLELALAANGDTLPADAGPTSFGDLPASTMFGFGFTGGADAVQKFWDQAQESMGDSGSSDLDQFAAMVQAQTGFVLPDDVKTLLGDDFALALDSEGFDVAASGQPDPASIRLGLRTSSGLADVQELVTKVEIMLSPFVPVDLVEREFDGGTVVASTEDYADILAQDGALADSENYQAAVADADGATAIVFADFDLALEVAERLGDMSEDERETLDVLRSFGVSAARDGDYTRATVRLVFD